jgi:GTP-binding protein
MRKAIVAVVGRPNVGKSTFFNKIVGKRISIVEDTPGVTRDRIYAEAEWLGVSFALIDTGGIEPHGADAIFSQMRAQAEAAMDTADTIVFMLDGKDGLTASDRDVANMLLRTRKPVIPVVNKVDTAVLPADFYDFYELGLGEPLAVSAANMLGLGEVLDRITDSLPRGEDDDAEDDAIGIAVIGKPNVGKSSLVNALLGEERVIVSEVAGTTRDAIDTPFEKDGQRFVLIDTAGLRRKSKVSDDIERYSVIRAVAAIERSDVCLLMLDAREGVTEQDKRIAGLAHEAGKGIVIVVNKWDLIEKETNTMKQFQKDLRGELGFIAYAPDLFISVLKKQRLTNVTDIARSVAEKRALRVATGPLNSLIADAVMMKQPPSDKGRRLKIYYAAQVGVKPPLFLFKVNDEALMHFSYARYLENRIREGFGFEGSSIKFLYRGKGERDAEDFAPGREGGARTPRGKRKGERDA